MGERQVFVLKIADFILLSTLVAFAPNSSADVESAQRLYRQGTLASGALLRGERDSNGYVEGSAAACVNCHRRSGFGTTEGKFIIPPISGKYLFRPHGDGPEDVDFRYGPAFIPKRDPYTDATLARAIRSGIGREGKPLSELMPRFALDDATMADLVAYLKNLSSGPVPGVTEDTLHFATVITPDADAVKRQGMLDVLERFFRDKNEFIRGGRLPMKSDRGVMYRVTRKWQLHVWELKGPADTWERQLQERIAAEPVFAMVSGLGGKTWAPIHRFCEHESIPCLLPNLDLPINAERDFYPVYFSKGVLLEAQLIANRLAERGKLAGTTRVLQIFREGDIGQETANALDHELKATGLSSESLVLKRPGSEQELARAVNSAKAGDVLVLWLRPKDLLLLPRTTNSQMVFVSGLMAELENAPLPLAWRETIRMTYPFDLPDLRKIRMNFPLGWFKVRNIPVVNERVQSDTYLACRILSESLGDMLDSFERDYLVEQLEAMLSRRLVNGYYPRLGLAAGQRFASKGGYIVRFAQPDFIHPVADGGWIVP
ncbi:MAG: cytochrome c [Polaromonas sp.]|uniref:c-type cytochrome n=1 Tax=Polaromonas sp. TaxID=1869339 RepID=UPI00185280ED|nr:cytochrome c [Polaromonas sp.]NMM09497.1 cytochrome c [Polaromonas sp.]